MDNKEYLIRPRVNTLLAHAIKHTLTIIHGGMGCGKTRAVYDFARECAFPVLWMQFSDSRNTSLHFWDCFVRALAQINKPFAKESKRLGFPDTADKVAMYLTLRDRMQEDIRRIYVLDDFHFVKDAAVLNFTEKCIYNAPKNISYILISRELPHINIAMASAIGKVYMISEDELNFTENEIHQFLLQQELSSETNSVPKIYKDTNGWAIIINFLARILKKTPGYAGYASNAIKQDISQLIATEIWNVISERLQRFFLRLSLTEHRSMDLVKVLAEGNSHLISELQQQNAFVRYDRYTDSYRIHRLFLNFLYDKQDLLTADEIRNTYTIIAEWCVSNDYIFDALFTYEKMGDYASITSILFASPVEFFEKYSLHIVNIFNRAPKKIFDHVEYSAAVHIHLTLCTDAWPKTLALTQHYEAKYLQLPEDNALRSRMLGCIYYYLGILHMLLCKANHYYDFDKYFAKQYEYLKNFPVNPKCWYQHPPSIWTNFVGSARAGAPQEYINALTRSMKYIHKCVNGLGAGLDNLCQGELFFYQCKIREAEFNLSNAMQRAQEYQQHEIISRVLFLIMRIAVFQGDYAKLTLALQDAERLLACNEYSTRFLTYDVVAGWHYCLLGQPERTPGWLKDQFSFRLPTHTLENLGNYTKTKYCYLVGNYAALLQYLENKRLQGTVLYERVESLTITACVHLKMNNVDAAFRFLQEAYETALPNDIVMPFIELGKDMRTLVDLAADCPECPIPHPWLKSIRQRASAYSRNQALIISGHKKTHGIVGKIALSPRETVILHDLRDGLSRSEIAAKHTISINTVKLHINSMYNKLGARNRADMFRIAVENNIL